MKKVIGGLFLTVLTSLLVNAQPPKGMGKSDPDAKKILDAVSTKFKSFKAVQSKFTLKIENSAGASLGSKNGTVYMKGKKYRISVTGQEIFCDGINVWTLDKTAKEVTISKVDASSSTITPQKLFTNFYDKDFLYRLNSETKGIQEIELTPIDKSKPFHKVLVYINKASQTITSTKVFEKTGNRYTYSVSGMNTNATVADAQFVFDAKKYPGVEVVDLR
ncbi:MAG: outer membrane lipoprotein carrier protein LolA [Chitinophagaceae bacterium]|nr:outer membrane lipoprotein carrier protein LolA [Chitinophagaceae bacterium]